MWVQGVMLLLGRLRWVVVEFCAHVWRWRDCYRPVLGCQEPRVQLSPQ